MTTCSAKLTDLKLPLLEMDSRPSVHQPGCKRTLPIGANPDAFGSFAVVFLARETLCQIIPSILRVGEVIVAPNYAERVVGVPLSRIAVRISEP